MTASPGADSTDLAQTGPFVDFYWLPVAAGTNSRVRLWSLALWEFADAAVHRRSRGALYHCGLKLRLARGATFTLELTPAFIGGDAPPAMTGPVGLPGADRFRLFRYQLRALETDTLPDEEWAVESPIRLTGDDRVARDLLTLAPSIPRHTWGLRVRGTKEMWTSNSAISWLLLRAGLDPTSIPLPTGGRAPGWAAGWQAAHRDGR
ncbi:MAG: hypothetical protein HY875_02490 [Chloroflexi bacterium]|nr:hypothetical protein [Chloroflexota bacterium]